MLYVILKLNGPYSLVVCATYSISCAVHIQLFP